MWEGVGDRTELQHIDPHSYGHQRFFPVLLGWSTGGWGPASLGAGFLYRILSPTGLVSKLINRGLEGSLRWVLAFSTTSCLQLVWSPNWLIGGLRAPSAGCWLSLPHLVSNWFGLQTDWISCPQCYITVQRPPSSCGRHKLHSFNPSTVKATLCYSSTGCTCYLHKCISYFDSPAGPLVNIQHIHMYMHTYINTFIHTYVYT